MPAKLATAQQVDDYATFLHGLVKQYPVDVTCERWRPVRSQEQLGAMFGLAYRTIMAESGLQGEEDRKLLHSQMCGEFWGWKVIDVLGKQRKVPKRTTTKDEAGNRVKFNKTEQAEFYEFICRQAAGCGIYIPAPDPRWKLDAQRAAWCAAKTPSPSPQPSRHTWRA